MSYNYNELYHYGVLGMKWGVRRYQNPDGTLTAAGRKRYGSNGQHQYKSWATKRRERKAAKAERRGSSNAKYLRSRAMASQKFDDAQLKYAKQTSTGKAILGNLVNMYGYKKYSMSRSLGVSRGKSVVNALLHTGRYTRNKYIDSQVGKPEKKTKRNSVSSNKLSKNKATQLYVNAHNKAAKQINREIDSINQKWAKKFEGYSNWQESPYYADYEAAVSKKYNEYLQKAMDEEMRNRR